MVQIKTVGLFPKDSRLHYVDCDLVITTVEGCPQVILRNGSRSTLSYALKLTGFNLKKGGWRKRPDGLSFHLLEAREEMNNGTGDAKSNSAVK